MSGFVGRTNGYRCAVCGGVTVTTDRDDGVTPMILACRASGDVGECEGRAVSAMYPAVIPSAWGPASWEWYAPSARELRRADAETREHCNLGGLLLRKVAS